MSTCLQASALLKNFLPLFDRVLVQRVAAEVKTKGGVLIPEKAQQKTVVGTVMAVGPGRRTDVSLLTRQLQISVPA